MYKCIVGSVFYLTVQGWSQITLMGTAYLSILLHASRGRVGTDIYGLVNLFPHDNFKCGLDTEYSWFTLSYLIDI